MEFQLSGDPRQEETIVRTSIHFGVSPDNYVASLPSIGIRTMEIAQAGLRVAARPDSRGRYYYAGPEQLLHNVFSSESTEIVAGDEAAYTVTEEVEEFCTQRSLSPNNLVVAGSRLLMFAALHNAGPDQELFVTGQRDKRKQLDSTLAFSVTPMNTVAVIRTEGNLGRKLLYKVRGY